MTVDLPLRANLGCGRDYRESWWNVDHDQDYKADAHFDLEDVPWTVDGERIPDGQFQVVVMDNVLEHLSNQLAVLEELARVTKADGGKVVLSGPHWNSKGAFVDPTHTRPFDPDTLQHYTVMQYYDVETVEIDRVRFGRVLPQGVARWLADHVGHIVSGFTVTARRTPVTP